MKQNKFGVIARLWEKGGLDMEVKELPTGLKIINTTPHQLMFVYKKGTKQQKYIEINRGDNDVIELFSADTTENTVDTISGTHEPITLVYPQFTPRYPEKIEKALEWAEKHDVYFVASLLTATAIAHKRVIIPITDSRKSTKVHLKTAEIDKFSTFYSEATI